MPSGFRYVAYTGHTLVHGGSSHCRHGRGRNRVRSSFSSTSTYIQLIVWPRAASLAPTAGTLFSALQAMTQAWEAVQGSRSITIPQSAMSGLGHFHPGCVEETEAPKRVGLVGDQVVLVRAFAAEEGDAHDLGRAAGDEPRPEPDPSLRRPHPHRVAVGDAELRGRLPGHLHPSLPRRPDEDGGLLEEPWLVPSASHPPPHHTIG